MNYDNTLELEMIEQFHEIYESFRNKHIFITGATGLMGKNLVRFFLLLNSNQQLNCSLILLIRNQEKLVSQFSKKILKDENIKIIIGDVNKPFNYLGTVDYIFHCASVTDSKQFVDAPVNTLDTLYFGMKNVLEFGKEKQVEKFINLSSLEVYGEVDSENISESEYGYIDFLKARSSYSEGKRMAECLSYAYFSQFGIPIINARLTQTFGPGVEFEDNRVFAQFARAAINNSDIILHTKGETKRTYCYISDAVNALVFLAAIGKPGEAYNIANEETYISIADMAQLVLEKFSSNNAKVVFNIADIEKFGYNPTVKIKLLTDKIRALGWEPKVGLDKMYGEMIRYWKDNQLY